LLTKWNTGNNNNNFHFNLLTHALFKALFFVCAGGVYDAFTMSLATSVTVYVIAQKITDTMQVKPQWAKR
jgi:NADH:ubiquinone oxidoreductase subunit 5 (subunit L)/multisubunit Na+/H+ antiporter MnhA subunit